jgi:chromosome segregation ATPase
VPLTFEVALDELYGVAPDEFILVRARLEKELKAAGDADGAAALKRRRRPHLAAWACNQLARRDADGVAELFEVTGQVAAAQQAALDGGSGDELREATRERQQVLDSLVDSAVRMLNGAAPKPEQYRDNIVATLDAATMEAERSEELRAGRLTQPLLAPAGFGPLDAALVTSASKPRARRASTRELDKARRDVDTARKVAEDAAAVVEEVDADVTSSQLHIETTSAHVGEVQRALERAEEAATEAQRQLGVATEAAETARRNARDAMARLEEAEARLASLQPDV